MYLDHDRRSSGETPPRTPQAAATGVVVPFPVSAVPKDEKAAKRARKPRKYAWGDKVREDENLSANAKVVAWYLCGLFDADEEAAFPTHAAIVKRTGLKNQKAVQRAIRELEDAGYLRRELGTGILGGNKYRPTWAKLSETPAKVDTSDTRGGQAGPPGDDTSDLPGVTAQTPIGQAENQKEEKPREAAHPRGAAARSFVGEGDRPLRGASSREPVLDLPTDSIFDPVDTAAAIARGHTAESVTEAEKSFRRLYAGKRKTAGQWREASRKWIEAERLPQPDPDEMVRVPKGNLMPDRRCKRSDVKPWESFVDSKGIRHPARKPSTERDVV